MPSPFPGMDPYLEQQPTWEGFHAWFMRELARQTMPKAQSMGCWIHVERTVYTKEPNGEIALIGAPDQTVGAEWSGSTWSGPAGGAVAVALAEPKAVHEVVLDPEDPERVKQDYLVVRDQGRLQRVLAVVEVLSPANKTGSYVPRYREKRAWFMASRAHFMEIDLLRAGDNPARRLFPELPATPYFIFVARKTSLGRNDEGFPIRLQDPLPVIGLPIGPPRPDLPLDLASAFHAAYDLSVSPWGNLYEQSPPGPSLADADDTWVRALLAEKNTTPQ